MEIGCAIKETLVSRGQEQTCHKVDLRMLENQKLACLFSELMRHLLASSKCVGIGQQRGQVATQSGPQGEQQYLKENREKKYINREEIK